MTTPRTSTSVLLEHTLPDGSAHFDWLIERPQDPREHRMISFRCQHDPLELEHSARWIGVRLPDHRAHYIDYEGPISGDRGSVRRVWRAECMLHEESPDAVEISLRTTLDQSDRASSNRNAPVPATDPWPIRRTVVQNADGTWTLRHP